PGLFQLRPTLAGTDQLELAEPGLLPLLAGLAGVDRQEMVETGTALLVLVGSGSLDGWFWEELLGRLDLRANLAGQDWREFWEPGLLQLWPALEGTYQLELGEIAGLALLPLSLGGVAQQVMTEPALAWVAVFSL